MNQPEIEKSILEFWRKNNIFQKSLFKPAPKGEYIFYDGPPFATGTPHYGHIVASLIKDMAPRYFTMAGYHVARRWGWDCHGLPIENIVEQEHGFKHKKDILAYGIDKFNEDARSKVLKYADEWRVVIERLGRWVDIDNAYRTMDPEFMESVWWVFKSLWDKGLVYEGFHCLHICPRCETTLSQSEVSEGYKEVEDLSVVVKFRVKKEAPNEGSLLGYDTLARPERLPPIIDDTIKNNFVNSQVVENKNRSESGPEGNRTPQGTVATLPATPVAGPYPQDRQNELYHILSSDAPVYLLAWTTTPWTLPGNAALAVKEDIEYVVVKTSDGSMILAKTIFEKWPAERKISGEIVAEVKGKDLVGLEYEPLFSYYNNDKLVNRANAFKIYSASFVNTDEGTGIVHIAPAFGEEDMNLAKAKNLPFIQHINMDGTFKEEAADFAGLTVKPIGDETSTDKKIVAYLEKRGLLFSSEKFRHSYPHCWRCESPLLNYTASSYFVAVVKIKERLLAAAENINWMPAHIKEGRFGKWLANARDWSISRQRFWGSVIPIWKCEGKTPSNSPLARGRTSGLPSLLRRGLGGGSGCGRIVVLGSISELEKLSGEKVTDLHKHFVDNITFPCPECNGVMRRIADVLDCWFESGAMPYAQAHYPFNLNPPLAKGGTWGGEDLPFPAAFIAEGVDQTRAWFYYLHVLAVALFDKSAFANAVVNGIVLAEDGQKMSKRLANYPDPIYMFDKYGADAVRYYLACSPVMSACDLNFSEKGVEEVVKKVLFTLYNVLAFYKMYAHDIPSPLRPVPRSLGEGGGEGRACPVLDTGVRSGADTRTHEASPTLTQPSLPLSARDRLLKGEGTDEHILDRWIISKLNVLIRGITTAYEAYDLNRAARPLGEFINELSTWFVRRSRNRFKGDDAVDKSNALATLRHVLLELSKTMAPVMPFAADHIYREIKNPLLSKKIPSFPRACPVLDTGRGRGGLGGGAKESVHLEQWPIPGQIDEKLLSEMEKTRQIVELGLSKRAEIGIKVRQPLQSITVSGVVVSEPLIELLRDELNVKEVIFVPFSVIPAAFSPREGGEGIQFNRNGLDSGSPPMAEAGMTTKADNLSIELDATVSPELQLEGHLRELTRQINALRKKAGLTPGDKIVLSYQTESGVLREVFSKFIDELKRAVIASEIREQDNEGEETAVNGEKIKWRLIKQKP